MKRRTKCCLSIILFVLPLSAAEDWRLLTEQMYGPDQERSAEARKQSFSALERLAKGSAEDISKELPQFLRLLDDERELFRQQGSGALAALAMFRVDGLTALQGAIPTFLSQFTNKETRIRENGVRSIAVIRPHPPLEALDSLKALLEPTESQPALATLSVIGLMRLAPRLPQAEAAVVSALKREERPDRLQPLLAGIGAMNSTAGPELISLLAGLGGSGNDDVANWATISLQNVGQAARAAAPIFQKIADDPDQSEARRQKAKTLLDRLRR